MERFKKEVLRCNRCGECYTPPHQGPKWEASARSSIILQKTHGMPFHRLAKLQSLCGVPVASSTLWHQCHDVWIEGAQAVYEELLALTAQSDLLYIDDTGAKILSVVVANKDVSTKKKKGCHTTIVRAQAEKQNLVVYITDQKTAGKNLGTLLEQRIHPHHSLKLMSDASSMNKIVIDSRQDKSFLEDLSLSQGYCLNHGLRKFKDLLPYYPEICGYFVEQGQLIYHHDHLCKTYSPRKRLTYHQQHSSGCIKTIYQKIHGLFKEKKVEPNSVLGQAMRYWLNHRKPLTAFLRVKGMPLDNNRAEEGLRSLILQRKNSYFFKTTYSARVLSGLHSIIKTCEVNQINSFSYLNWLQKQGSKVYHHPSAYLPFAYQKEIESRGPPNERAA